MTLWRLSYLVAAIDLFMIPEMLNGQLLSCPTTQKSRTRQFSVFLLYLVCLQRKKDLSCPPGTTFGDVQITHLKFN
jgi:hypothetical protein